MAYRAYLLGVFCSLAVVENVVTTYKKMKKRAEAKGVGYHDSNRLRRFVDDTYPFLGLSLGQSSKGRTRDFDSRGGGSIPLCSAIR